MAQTHKGINRNLLVLGVITLLALGGIAALLASRNGGSIFSTLNNITNQIIHNSYFTQLIASGVTTEKDLQAIAEIRPYGDGFIGISKETLYWAQALDLAKRTGARVLTIENGGADYGKKLTKWLASSFTSHLTSTVWVSQRNEARVLDGPDVLSLTSLEYPRKVFLQWGAFRKDEARTPISLNPPQVEAATGKVIISGVDPSRPGKPFTWNWGDGAFENGWFPNTHVYSDTQKEYQVTVTAHYDDGETQAAKTTVSFKPAKAETRTPIRLNPPQVEAATGKVTINGVDPSRPGKPFTWNWGDGAIENGWFPNTHVYSDTQKEYQVTVTAHYDDGETQEAKTTVSFASSK